MEYIKYTDLLETEILNIKKEIDEEIY